MPSSPFTLLQPSLGAGGVQNVYPIPPHWLTSAFPSARRVTCATLPTRGQGLPSPGRRGLHGTFASSRQVF